MLSLNTNFPKTFFFVCLISVNHAVHFLQVLGNVTEFHRAVKLVIDTVSFDKDSTVQVFEANIRYKCANV